MSGRRLLAAALALPLLLASPPARALSDAGKRSYVDGVRAVEDGEYESAVRKLREAVKDDPVEGLRKFRGSGVNYEDYFPHLYLGLALEKLGRATEAQSELEESQRQGVSRGKAKVYALLVAALDRAQAAAATTIAQVRPTAAPTAPPPPPTSTPRVVPPTPPVALPTATAPPRPFPTALRPTALPTEPPRLPVTPTPRPTIIPIPPPEPVGTAPSPAVLADLKSGIRAYFHGDFESAIRVLTPRREASGTARLFLAYALAGKYLVGGPGRDEQLLARAREEYRSAAGARQPEREGQLISTAVRTILEGG